MKIYRFGVQEEDYYREAQYEEWGEEENREWWDRRYRSRDEEEPQLEQEDDR